MNHLRTFAYETKGEVDDKRCDSYHPPDITGSDERSAKPQWYPGDVTIKSIKSEWDRKQEGSPKDAQRRSNKGPEAWMQFPAPLGKIEPRDQELREQSGKGDADIG